MAAYKSSAMKRRLQVFPSARYHRLVKAYAKVSCDSESKVVSIAIKYFFDGMTEEQRQQLLFNASNFA